MLGHRLVQLYLDGVAQSTGVFKMRLQQLAHPHFCVGTQNPQTISRQVRSYCVVSSTIQESRIGGQTTHEELLYLHKQADLNGCTSHDVSTRITGLPVVFHPSYSSPRLAPGHRFPMKVFEHTYRCLLRDGIIQQHQVHVPPVLASRDQLCLVHDQQYVDNFRSGQLSHQQQRRIGLGDTLRSPTFIHRTEAEVAGTILTARLALRTGLAVNVAGGTHHAFPAEGSGYCVINDLAVTCKILLSEQQVQRILVVDLDVHQGDGTAVCLQDDPRCFTLSFHGESNFPVRKQRSTLDVGLPDGTGDNDYMSRLGEVLSHVVNTFRPDLVLYDAGVDVHVNDALGRLCLTDDGLRRREALVLDTCLAAGIPIAGYVGGGYDDDLEVLAQRHCILHATAQQFWRDYNL